MSRMWSFTACITSMPRPRRWSTAPRRDRLDIAGTERRPLPLACRSRFAITATCARTVPSPSRTKCVPPTVCSQSSSVKPSPSSANASRRSVPDLGGFGFGEVRGGDLTDRDDRFSHGREATGSGGNTPVLGSLPCGTAHSDGRSLGPSVGSVPGGASAHPPLPTRRGIPALPVDTQMRGDLAMSRTRLSPLPRRVAIFLVASALVATISPGLVLAANGPPAPVDDPVNTTEDAPTNGNVLTNDGNHGDGPLSVPTFVPSVRHRHAQHRHERRLRVHARP